MNRLIPKILLVDDDDVFFEVVERALKKTGFDCQLSFSLSLAEAYRYLEKDSFDCILLDHKLSDGDSFALLARIADKPLPPAVIMLTSNEDIDVAVRAMKNGVVDFINKRKLSDAKLKDAIEKAIEFRENSEKAERERNELHRMSFYDELTGLANRNLLHDRLAQAVKSAQRNGQFFALFMMDLNLFKEVNDTFGHEAGDEVLRITGHRLSSCLRETDTVGRLGGDEFVAILEGTQSVEGAVVGAKKIIREMSKPIEFAGAAVNVGLSVGIAMYPEDGGDSQSLLKTADTAMYEAKSTEEHYCLATPPSSNTNKPRTIAAAIQNSDLLPQIDLHYQPKIEFNSPEIYGYEALARWNHPELGLLLPAEFIPALERTNAIKAVTLHTIERAFLQQKLWCDAGLEVPIALNISKQMLKEAEFPGQVEQRLKAFGVNPNLINFEFSEIASLKNQKLALRIIRKFAEIGIQVSIGDFGAGYTSLKYLTDLPVTEIKLDRSFLIDLEQKNLNRSIIRSVSVLAEGVGCDVVAVGVESLQTWEQIIGLGCQRGQGYYFAPPMTVEDLDKWRGRWVTQVATLEIDNAILPAVRQG